MMNNNQAFGVWTALFSGSSEPLFKKLRTTLILLIIYSTIILMVETFYSSFFEKLQVENLGQFHLIFSFILSILIAFRVNSSYNRWWEARGYMGALMNNSRNLTIKFNTFIGFKNCPLFLSYLSQLPILIKHHLRKDREQCELILIHLGLKFTNTDHLPSVLINKMYLIINNYRNEDKIKLEQYLSLDEHLVNITDLIGSCEKIINTPVPFYFKVFIKQALFFYMLIFPFGWVEKFGFLIIPMIIVTVYVLLGLENLSESLEEPFTESLGEHSKLPLDEITNAISNNIQNIAGL